MSKKNYDDNAYEDEEEEEESDDNKTNISKKDDHKDIPKKDNDYEMIIEQLKNNNLEFPIIINISNKFGNFLRAILEKDYEKEKKSQTDQNEILRVLAGKLNGYVDMLSKSK